MVRKREDINWLSRERMCGKKEEGGIEFQNLRYFNATML